MAPASASSVALSAVNAAPVKPVVAWGYNGNGQTTLPSLSGVAAVAGGESHSIALLDAGTLVAWGLNTSGQTTVPGTATGVTDIAAGVDYNLARKSNGTIVAWGSNASGKATVPSDITTATKVAAGKDHSLALLANGTVRAWGDNSWGQTTIPSSLTGVTVTAIASGYDHNLALTAAGAVVAGELHALRDERAVSDVRGRDRALPAYAGGFRLLRSQGGRGGGLDQSFGIESAAESPLRGDLRRSRRGVAGAAPEFFP